MTSWQSLCVAAAFLIAAYSAHAEATDRPPNVVMIAIDDLNDWVGCLGGHPQGYSPNIDRLAQRGFLFRNAHCQAPICNPSRVSLMTGLQPARTGVYYLGARLSQVPSVNKRPTIPSHFAAHGYRVAGFGKLVHTHNHEHFPEYGGDFGGFGPSTDPPLNYGISHPLWDWGALDVEDEAMPDHKVADAAIGWLNAAEEETPFFLGVGFHRPHVPMNVPRRWFDRFPLQDVQLPPYLKGDLDDISDYARDKTWSIMSPRHSWIIENDQAKKVVQAYLASVAFVDEQVGRVLDALEESTHGDNTIVVLWSDHGFHLGSKERWSKRTLWEESTRVPLVIATPNTPGNQQLATPVGLIDVFPTLIDLCGLAEIDDLDGESLGPLIQNPDAEYDRYSITSFGPGCHAVRTHGWRMIRYADGSEELYDYSTDPHGFDNLADVPAHAERLEQLRRLLPQSAVPMVEGSLNADARPGSAAEIEPDRLRREARRARPGGG